MKQTSCWNLADFTLLIALVTSEGSNMPAQSYQLEIVKKLAGIVHVSLSSEFLIASSSSHCVV